MNPPPARALMTLLVTLLVQGCATHAPRTDQRPVAEITRDSLLVDNDTRQRIDVYLIEATQDYLLGRLEAGSKKWLSLPARSAVPGAGWVSLAVLVDAPRSLRPSRDANAVLTIRQPMTALLGQRWVFAENQLRGSSPRL